MTPIDVLQFIGLPVVVATGIVLMGWWLLPSKRLQPLGAIIAVGVSSLVAFSLQDGIPSIPPQEKWHWLIITSTIVAVLACVYPLCKKWDKLIVFQAFIAGIIAAVFMQFPNQNGLFERIIILLMVLFISVSLRRLTIPPWHMYIASWSILACISVLALQASFAKLAFFAGAMSAVAAALVVLQCIKPRETKSVQMIFGVFIVGCAMCGLAYDPARNVPPFAWILPMLGVPIAAIAYLLCKAKLRAVVSLVLLESCIAIAIYWTFANAVPQNEMWP